MKFEADFILPFKLPVEDKLKILSKYHFGEFQTKFESIQDGFDIELNNVNRDRTYLNILFFPNQSLTKDPDKAELMRQFVLSSIWHINKIIDSLKLSYSLQNLYKLSVKDLPSLIIITIDKDTYAYLTNNNLIDERVFIKSAKDFDKAGSYLSSLDLYPEIFMVDTFYESAKTNLHYEKFPNFVIDLQTSFEIFIRNTLKLILKSKNEKTSTIQKIDTYPFRNIIEQHLGKHLKVDLNFESNKIINDWYIKLYLLRNNIVHKGMLNITSEDAHKAIDAYETARNYLSDLLVTEGYLDSKGKVKLNLFKKNIYNPESHAELLKNMKDRGLVSKELKPMIREVKV